jgi:hypothetical protein
MKKERNSRPSRKMKPVFLVFCEGETEEAYINFLRQKYRLPIKIISRMTGLSISPAIIKRYVQAEKISPGDNITSFLMYDLDTAGITEKLLLIKGSITITSNPCVELWFLLHNKEQHAEIATKTCITMLQHFSDDWTYYEKGIFTDRQKQMLWNNCIIACDRARKLPESINPSSTIYRLVEAMDLVKGDLL